MLGGVQPESSLFRRYRAVGSSVAAHMAILAAIVFHHPKPIDITPTWLAWGDSQHSYRISYLPNGNNPAEQAKLILPSASRQPSLKPAQSKKPKVAPAHHELAANADEGTTDTKAGSALGRVVDGPIIGHEVHVAFPTVYPDPPVDRAELPRDLIGDVVIEVTIDSEGNVVETKIVQAIGHGIDEKIEATLRRWHYQPATLDGTPVASHHDVHFHFPS
ncbi:MAG: TonB family protein [Terriglobales bacterium]